MLRKRPKNVWAVFKYICHIVLKDSADIKFHGVEIYTECPAIKWGGT